MKTYSIIPARSGSKGVPNKNIKLLNGFPLIAYSIVASKLCKDIDECYVTTDSEEYANIALNYGASVIIRPEYCSDDNAGDIDYLLHAIYTTGMDLDDTIVLLRPTTPLRDVSVIGKAIEVFKKTSFESLRSVHRLNESPEKMYKCLLNTERLIPYLDIDFEKANLPRQSFEQCYQPNGYIDILKVETIVRKKMVYGNRIMKYETNRASEIDTIDDFEYIEYCIKKEKNEIYRYLKKGAA